MKENLIKKNMFGYRENVRKKKEKKYNKKII